MLRTAGKSHEGYRGACKTWRKCIERGGGEEAGEIKCDKRRVELIRDMENVCEY